MSWKMIGIFRKRQEEKKPPVKTEYKSESGFHCPHEPITEPFDVEVLGVLCSFNDSPFCLECTREYLNKFSTLCGTCRRSIFPHTAVGRSKNPDFLYAHLTFGCCDTGGDLIGEWSEGKLITLHELHPEKYPPGEQSIVEQMLGGPAKVMAKASSRTVHNRRTN
jgi:hypothetical protein